MKKHIPNLLTCSNLISGCIATYYAFCGEYQIAFLLIMLGATFDFFDGFAARLLHVASPIGKELDSLADDITFGFAPAAIVFSLIQTLLLPANCPANCPVTTWGITPYLPCGAFLIAAFSALRLAKFNLDERQTTTFIGMPTPANALFWGSLSVGMESTGWLTGEPWLAFALLGGVVASCWLLVCEIPMFALKFKSFAVKDNVLRYSFILCSAILLIWLQWMGFAVIILLYIMISVMNNLITSNMIRNE